MFSVSKAISCFQWRHWSWHTNACILCLELRKPVVWFKDNNEYTLCYWCEALSESKRNVQFNENSNTHSVACLLIWCWFFTWVPCWCAFLFSITVHTSVIDMFNLISFVLNKTKCLYICMFLYFSGLKSKVSVPYAKKI